MKTPVRRFLLSLLGFSAAPILTACYGMPYHDYDNVPFEGLDGEVIDADTKKPIANIKVHYTQDSTDGPLEFSTRTDANGKFIFDESHIFNHGTTIHLTDVDGAENGLYQDRTFYASANFNEERTISMWAKVEAEQQ